MFSHNFKARARKNKEPIVSSVEPLADIIYLLQVLFPGMLVLARTDEKGDTKKQKVLPSTEWLKKQKPDLSSILGRNVFKSVLDAARNGEKDDVPLSGSSVPNTKPAKRGRVVRTELYSGGREGIGYCGSAGGLGYYDVCGRGYDWTVCDKDCGWCGRCEWDV